MGVRAIGIPIGSAAPALAPGAFSTKIACVPQFRICRGRSSHCDFLYLGTRIYDMGIAHSLGCPTSSGVLTQGCFAHSGSWVALGESKVPPERFCTMWAWPHSGCCH